MANKTTWVKVDSKRHVSKETTSNGKPTYMLKKDAHFHDWRLLVWADDVNRYLVSQFLCYNLPEIKKFFAVCDLKKVGRCLEEI